MERNKVHSIELMILLFTCLGIDFCRMPEKLQNVQITPGNQNILLVIAYGLLILIGLFPIQVIGQKYHTYIVSGNWTGSEGMQIFVLRNKKDLMTINFNAGSDANCAQAIVNRAQMPLDDGSPNPYTITRVGTKVRICHPKYSPRVLRVGIKNNVIDSSPTEGAKLLSNNLVSFTGIAKGNGLVSITVENLVAKIHTIEGQSAEEIVSDLVDELDKITPENDTTYAYGLDFMANSLGGNPVDSINISIWSMGEKELSNILVVSTDAGIVTNLITDINDPRTISKGLILQQNNPNPFKRNTEIKYHLPTTGYVSIHIYNVQGKLVRALISRTSSGGHHSIIWDGYNDLGIPVNGGLYFYEIKFNDLRISRTALKIR